MSKALAQSWKTLAREQRTAAIMCSEKRLYRASSSRAYYSAYALVTSRLVESGAFVSEASGAGEVRNNPSHKGLDRLIHQKLKPLKKGQRERVRDAVGRLLKSRVLADYVPQANVDEVMSRRAIRDLFETSNVLGELT